MAAGRRRRGGGQVEGGWRVSGLFPSRQVKQTVSPAKANRWRRLQRTAMEAHELHGAGPSIRAEGLMSPFIHTSGKWKKGNGRAALACDVLRDGVKRWRRGVTGRRETTLGRTARPGRMQSSWCRTFAGERRLLVVWIFFIFRVIYLSFSDFLRNCLLTVRRSQVRFWAWGLF